MKELAAAIIAARQSGDLLSAPTEHQLDEQQAYAIQSRVMAPRLADGGGIAGWKLGYTSAAMREQMGVERPNFGPLAHAMLLEDGAVIDTGVVQPKVEPEIAAVIGTPISPGASPAEVSAAVSEWRLALEVVDSVWRDYRFDWALNTADGSSAAFAVLGPVLPSADVQLLSLDVNLRRNGMQVGQGRATAAMGDPCLALLWLAERLGEQKMRLEPGDVVITGGLCSAVTLEPGDLIEASSGDVRVHLHRATSGIS